MYRMCRIVPVLAFVGILATPALSRASFQLKLQSDGGPVTTVTVAPNAGPAMFSGTVGAFSLVIAYGDSTSPGGPANGLTEVGSISITNLTSATHTLHVSASSQGFTSPNSPPPLTVIDTVSGTLVSGTLSGNFQGFTDASNTLFGTGFAAPLLTITPITGTSQSFSDNGTALTGFSPNGNTYSMSVFENLTLSGHGSLTLTGGNVQTLATPAPAGIVLGIGGIACGGLLRVVRGRKAVQPV